jgi:hypothetical protein
MSDSANITSEGKITADEARNKALAFNKAGDKKSAVEWLRIAKQLETDSKQVRSDSRRDASLALDPSISTSISQSTTGPDSFTPLENALNEAQQTTFREAKVHRERHEYCCLSQNVDRLRRIQETRSLQLKNFEISSTGSRNCKCYNLVESSPEPNPHFSSGALKPERFEYLYM